MTPEIQPGDVFDGRYRIDGVLGKGGFARVFLATDVGANQTVALKILTREHGGYDRETTLRFERETRILESLAHPHIVDILGHGLSADGYLYIAFEHLPGQDLTEFLHERGTLDPDTVVHVLRQLLDALRHAHEAGLLHRDIKPANVRIYKKGNDPTWIKLLDFGIARATEDGSPTVSKTGEIIGTPRYMSPEQLYSRPLGPASDIYSLGVLALELLLGRDAIQGNRLGDQIDRVRSGYVFPVASVAHYGDGLLQIIARMTSVNPEDRYQSAGAVLSAINSLERDPTRQEAPPREPPLTEPPTRPGERRWMVIAGLAVLALGLIPPVLLVISTHDEPSPSVPVLPPQLLQAESEVKALNVRDDLSVEPQPDATIKVGDGCGVRPPFLAQGSLRLLDESVVAHIPNTYDARVRHPVVLLLHDKLRPPSNWLATSGFAKLADQHGFVVLAPDGNVFNAWDRNYAEVPRLHALIEFAAADLCLDLSHIFVVGHGDGGPPAYRLACEDWVTAVAVSGYLRGTEGFKCKGAVNPKPFLLLVADNDPSAPLEGGRNCLGSEKLSLARERQLWRERNRCTGPPAKQDLAYGVCATWTTCEAPLVVCKIEGGHNWPGSAERPEVTKCENGSTRFDSAARTWDFFAKFSGAPAPVSPTR